MRFVLVHSEARRRAQEAIAAAPDGYTATIAPPARNSGQNSKFHVMFDVIAKRTTFCGRRLSPEYWKRLLIEGYVHVARQDARANGKPDPFPQTVEFLPSLDGLRPVPIGVSSRHFDKEQASDFIEYVAAYAATHGINLDEDQHAGRIAIEIDEQDW